MIGHYLNPENASHFYKILKNKWIGVNVFILDDFISEHVIKRSYSMFYQDIEKNKQTLHCKIEGKTVLVIGGAGSIGSSFIKALLPYRPAAIVVVDTNENALAELVRDVRSSDVASVPDTFMLYPMDYASSTFERMIHANEGFDIVANFSAHKHVRSEKDVFSIEALITNNVLNAKHLLGLLEEYPPEEFFCVSTDKAANPVNIMGASKRIMEDVIFGYSDKFSIKTARFANVAFSNGSLPAGFLERMRKLQPLSGPSDVKRYFISPEESGEICLLACVLGNNRDIFFPKLSEDQMMSFSEIGFELLKANGYRAIPCDSADEAIRKAKLLKEGSNNYPVYFSVSDTSGEKCIEEFYTKDEIVDLNRFESLGVVMGKKKPDIVKLETLLERLGLAFTNEAGKEDIIEIIQDYLPSFRHLELKKNLDGKM